MTNARCLQNIRLLLLLQSEDTTKFFATRAQAEEQATGVHMTPNKLHAFALTDLLNERKSVTTPEELERLARRFGISVAKLQSVSRFISSPSVIGDEAIKVVDSEGEEHITTRASQYFFLLILLLSLILAGIGYLD